MNTEARSETALDAEPQSPSQPQPQSGPQSEVEGQAASRSTSLDPRGLLARLQEVSPAFRDTKPLALRIDKAIAARFPEVERKVIRTAMRMHTASTRYLKAMERATHRFDLDGREDGEVTEEHRTHAAQTLKERFAEVGRRKREQEKQAEAQRREQEAERRKAEKLQQLVGKFSRG